MPNQGPHTSEGPTCSREILTLLMSGDLCASRPPGTQEAFCAQGCPVSAGSTESVLVLDASLFSQPEPLCGLSDVGRYS